MVVNDNVTLRWAKLVHLVAEYTPQYSALLMMFCSDRKLVGETYLGFQRAPAAKKNHHAEEGGLVRHLLEMWDIHMEMRDSSGLWTMSLSGSVQAFPKPDVLKGIINHDLHKAFHTYKLVSESPWAVEYGRNIDEDLLTDNVKSLWMLSQCSIPMSSYDLNVLCWSEGGFAAHPRPRERTALAVFVYLLDEMSGNVVARLREGTHMIQSPHRKWESGGTR